MKAILIFLIRCYQRGIAPILPPRCRFEPTCSAYAIEAIRKKGALRGTLKAAWRLLRCNPYCRGGYDPVDPPEGRDPELASPAAVPAPSGASVTSHGRKPVEPRPEAGQPQRGV